MIFNKIVYGSVTIFDILIVVAILMVGILIAKVVTFYLRRSFKDKVDKDRLQTIVRVAYYSIIIIAVLTVLPILGIKLSGLLVAGGIAGFVIGFASQKIVGNLISGFFLIIEKPIKIGDAVNIDGIAGIVKDIRIISTVIRTWDGIHIRIPNEKVFTTNITNYVANVVRRFEYVVGIRYNDDADKAINIIKNLIEEHPFALKDPPSQAFVDNLGDNSINIIVRIWAPVNEWYEVKMELLLEIKKALEKEGIEIAFPQRMVWFANELRRGEVKDVESSESSFH